MKRHEDACTANPNRTCRMCAMKPDMPDLIAATKKCTESNIEPLREMAEGCPACMLAGIRQSGMQSPQTSLEDPGFYFEFDFKKERESWWEMVNDEHRAIAGY